jgi:hypothetical protein
VSSARDTLPPAAHRAVPRAPNVPVPASGAAIGLERAGVLPALATAAWLLATFPLLLVDALRPIAAVPLFLVVAAPLLRLGWRTRTTHGGGGRWPAVAVVLIAVGSGVANALLHSEHLVLRRDAGSYAQIGLWLAGHGALPIPAHLAAFGGPDPALDPSSPAFYPAGDALDPQFMSGLPLLLAGAVWLAPGRPQPPPE